MTTAHGLGAEDAARVARLVAAYLEVDARMRELPIYNRRLHVEALGFRAIDEGLLGVMITPWVISAALLRVPAPPPGTRRVALPSGAYEFTTTELSSSGVLETCSLLSPVLQLADHSAARAFAAVALRALLEPRAGRPQADAGAIGRRGLVGALLGREGSR